MSNVQLYLAICIPTVLVLTGLLLNWSATRKLGQRLVNRLTILESDMRQFYHLTGKLEAESTRSNNDFKDDPPSHLTAPSTRFDPSRGRSYPI